MAQPDNQEQPQYTAKWGDHSGTPLVVGDLLHWRTTADRCILTIGQMDLPITEGVIPAGTEIPIRPVVRIMLTPDTLQTWATILTEAALQFTPPRATK